MVGDDLPQHRQAIDTAMDVFVQVIDAVDRHWVGQAAGLEGPADLVVQVDPVGQHHQVRIGKRTIRDRQVCLQLQRQKHHGQALAGTLGVPNQASVVLAVDDPFGDLIHRPELMIAADLLNGGAGIRVGLEDDEMGQQIQQS